ncbi:MAG: PQQ-binding-like beta-propeller repeat protein [Vicinamibacterales bacterium]
MRRDPSSWSTLALLVLLGAGVLAASPQPPQPPADGRPAPGDRAAPSSTSSSILSLFPALPVFDHALDQFVTAPPAFAGTRAFFAAGTDQITAFDLVLGTEAWQASGSPISAPAAGDGLLYLAEAERITALQQTDGRVAWRLPFAAQLAVPLVWDNGWLIAADTSGTVFAFRATDGELIWRRDLGVRVNASPALAADRVYVPLQDGRVVSLDVSTGAEGWTRMLGGPPNDMLALDDRIYVGSDDNYLYCLMARNGDVGWRWRTGGDVIGVPIVDDSRVYFVSRDNVLRALDRRSGAQRWKRALAARPTRGAVRAGDLLLVSGLTPRVYSFAMKDGTPAGDIAASGELASAPYVVPDSVLPVVVLVSRDVTRGTRILAVRRSINPPMNTPLPTLPGVITMTVPGTTPPQNAAPPGPLPAPR